MKIEQGIPCWVQNPTNPGEKIPCKEFLQYCENMTKSQHSFNICLNGRNIFFPFIGTPQRRTLLECALGGCKTLADLNACYFSAQNETLPRLLHKPCPS